MAMKNGEEKRIRRYAAIIAVAWTLIIGGFLVWNISHTKEATVDRAMRDALANFKKDVAFRQWVVKHGGVYVPVTEETPPNPNLSHIPERDIKTPSGKNLTLMNPAYALRQLTEDFAGMYGIRGHITSLKPLRELNAPDEWEKKALLQFEKGVKEVSEFITINGKPYFRMIRPFIAEKACLKCHAAQGYKEGDIRGGIGISLPMEEYLKEEREEIKLHTFTYGLTWAVVLCAVYLVFLRLKRHISIRRKAEDETKLLAERNEMILRSAAEGIIGLDSDGIQTFVNPSAAEMLGYSHDELINKKSHPIWHHTRPGGTPYAQEECPMCRAYQQGEIVRMEEIFWRKDGSSFPVEYAVMPIKEDERVIGAVVTFEDITDRKRAEEELRKSEESFKVAQRVARIGSWELDLFTNYLAWSDEVYRIFEIEPKEFGNSHEAFLSYVHHEDREFVNKAYNDSVINHTPYNIVHRLTMKDGRVKYVNEQCETEYDANGRPLRSIGTVQDITEQRRLEEQFRHAQKMESIGAFAGGIAHDFNNILAAIIGYGSVMKMKMKPDDPLRLNIEHILEAAAKAAHLTKDILLFSRKQVSDRQPVDLNSIIKDVEKFLVRVIGEDIACRTTLSERGIPVLADTHQIEQVLMNLAANARDAMPGGGVFSIVTEEIMLDNQFIALHGYGKAGMYALLTVSDTGAGMDEETRQKIFEPFFTTKEVGKGTGLGLAVAYGIIKQHDGYIDVYSEIGKGTTFIIYLPLISLNIENEKKTLVEEVPVKGTGTILLAEDDEAVRRLTKSVLEEYGYTVITAADGEDAVNKFKENSDRIELLLFDLIMPKKTGKEAYDEIRAVRPEIKAIFSSGYAPDMIRDKMHFGDDVTIVFKPVSPMELLRKVRQALVP